MRVGRVSVIWFRLSRLRPVAPACQVLLYCIVGSASVACPRRQDRPTTTTITALFHRTSASSSCSPTTDLYSHGKTHFERGDVQAALESFLEAHRVAVTINAPDASMAQLLNNLALCSQQLDRWKEATDYCERCLMVRACACARAQRLCV